LKEWFAESYSYYMTANKNYVRNAEPAPLGRAKDVIDPVFFTILKEAQRYGKETSRPNITQKELQRLDNLFYKGVYLKDD